MRLRNEKILLHIVLIGICICWFKGCVGDESTIDETTNINSPSAHEDILETTNKFDVDIYIDYIEPTGLNYSDDAYVYLDDK